MAPQVRCTCTQCAPGRIVAPQTRSEHERADIRRKLDETRTQRDFRASDVAVENTDAMEEDAPQSVVEKLQKVDFAAGMYSKLEGHYEELLTFHSTSANPKAAGLALCMDESFCRSEPSKL